MKSKKKLSWEVQKMIYTAIGVVLILVLGFFLVDRALYAVLQWAFRPTILEGFDNRSATQMLQGEGISIPENAQFLYGEYYGGQDKSMDMLFSVPYTGNPAKLPEYLQSVLLDDARVWDEVNYTSNFHKTFLSHIPDIPEAIGSICVMKDGCILKIEYSSPVDGSVYVLLQCSTGLSFPKSSAPIS